MRIFTGMAIAVSLTTHCAAQHRISAGVVANVPVSGWKASFVEPRPGFSADYEYRLHRLLGAEAGAQPVWTSYLECSRFACAQANRPLLLTQFGVRGYLPLMPERVEISTGAGGGYAAWLGGLPDYYSDWMWQASARVQFALDEGRRYWLGPSARFYSDGGRPTQRWVVVGLDFSWKPRGK